MTLEKTIDFLTKPDIKMGCLFMACALGATAMTALEGCLAYISFNESNPNLIEGGIYSSIAFIGSFISGFSYTRAVQSFKGD
jgi:hypothetical protein